MLYHAETEKIEAVCPTCGQIHKMLVPRDYLLSEHRWRAGDYEVMVCRDCGLDVIRKRIRLTDRTD